MDQAHRDREGSFLEDEGKFTLLLVAASLGVESLGVGADPLVEPQDLSRVEVLHHVTAKVKERRVSESLNKMLAWLREHLLMITKQKYHHSPPHEHVVTQ